MKSHSGPWSRPEMPSGGDQQKKGELSSQRALSGSQMKTNTFLTIPEGARQDLEADSDGAR